MKKKIVTLWQRNLVDHTLQQQLKGHNESWETWCVPPNRICWEPKAIYMALLEEEILPSSDHEETREAQHLLQQLAWNLWKIEGFFFFQLFFFWWCWDSNPARALYMLGKQSIGTPCTQIWNHSFIKSEKRRERFQIEGATEHLIYIQSWLGGILGETDQ